MIESAPSSWSVIDLLDQVLNSGIVIDSSVRVAVAAIELLTVEVVVVSTTVYLSYASQPISALRSHAIGTELTSTPTKGTP